MFSRCWLSWAGVAWFPLLGGVMLICGLRCVYSCQVVLRFVARVLLRCCGVAVLRACMAGAVVEVSPALPVAVVSILGGHAE